MEVSLRGILPEDRLVLKQMLARVKEFNQEDQDLAMELVNITLDQSDQKDYCFNIATVEAGRLIGFICFGPTPLTDGTYDLYWIAVDPDFAGRGVGKLLLGSMEHTLSTAQGRMILIETSSDPAYERTRGFYLRNGYVLAETIQDFYRDGEDRVTYVKRLSHRRSSSPS
jgi:ribosomal protein S18 acetylase RimI-like enzyme